MKRYKHNRERILSTIIVFSIALPFFLANMFFGFFPAWFYTRLFGIAFGIVFTVSGLFLSLRQIGNKFKRVWCRVLFVVVGVVVIILMYPEASAGVLDLKAYYLKDYKTTTGVPDYIGSMGKKMRQQTIELNNIELINTKSDSSLHDRTKVLEITYLPHSKFVINIKVVE
ncbi:hypothetical protein [Paenibacillus sp. JJ-223]|uniref:hypothetical protein n=1 Tax=Paenibacillus sp. JJ-223 TaxID=2905647 RepID=UPI001F26F0FC|nr:hypothetical protein [Paenibacillus sp. JJ-223]CAH1211609.1 hypothetical protein PAECIP111890_03767 [Paenibacillus sp. JJ-223]